MREINFIHFFFAADFSSLTFSVRRKQKKKKKSARFNFLQAHFDAHFDEGKS